MNEEITDLAQLVPQRVNGWEISIDDQRYDRETLYDYIDGGAELYLSYGFKQLLTRTYARAGQPEIIVDLFDMNSSYDAFGVFSHSRETLDDTYGQGSQYTVGLLLFWKDRYFVSILASPETEESKIAVAVLARSIDNSITGEGQIPPIIALLPRESLAKESIRYFHHYIWLNSHYFIATENILHIDETTEAVLAKYEDSGKRQFLLLIRYEDENDALTGHDDFVSNFLPELSKRGVAQIEDSMWTGCRLQGNLVSIVLNAQTEDYVLQLLDSVSTRIESRE